MIITIAVENLMLFATIFFGRNLAHNLIGFFVCFRTRVRVINPAHTWHLVNQVLSKQSPRQGTCAVSEIVKLNQLIAYCIRNRFTAIAYVYSPHSARNTIKIFFALSVDYSHSLAFNNHKRIVFF